MADIDGGVTKAEEAPLVPLPAAAEADGAPPPEEAEEAKEDDDDDAPAAVPEVAARRPLTTEERIARGIAPVKPEYLVTAQAKVSVAGAGAGGARSDKKSRRQIKQEKKQERQNSLCWAFAKGSCTFGDQCRRGHDLSEYLSSKEPELPGQCPFESAEACPYGIMCRWMSKHKKPDDLTAKCLEEQKKKAAAAAEGGDEGEPSGEAAAEEAKEEAAETGAGKVATQEGASGSAEAEEEAEAMAEAEAGEAEAGEAEAKAEEEASGDGTVPAGVLELPVGDKLEAEVNAIPMSLVQDLRKRVDLFPRSTAILKELGLQNSGKKSFKQKHQAKKQRGAGDADVSSAQEAKIYDVTRSSSNNNEGVGGNEEADGTGFEGERVRLRPEEKARLDFRGKLYLAPLTTTGNLPFRRVCKALGADITCGEMAMATNLLQGSKSEWALLKRHPCEDMFGVQICGGYPDAIAKAAEMLEDNVSMDFLDVNCGCPIDLVCNKGAGSSLLNRLDRLEGLVRAGSAMVSCPFTFKTRKAFYDNQDITHTFVDKVSGWGAAAMTLHGRTRAQRYSRRADWDYITRCAKISAPTGLQLIGNGDVYSYEDYRQHMEATRGEDGELSLATCMIARGALIKPWIFTEIKEQRAWDISASERLDILKQFCNTGLEHWGSDSKGVETTRRFLLEALSFLHRYIPLGLLEVARPELCWRPPSFVCRNDLETLFSSASCADWVRISEMLLGPPPPGFSFSPKHKSNAFANASTEG